jgi:hypothetical protein
MYVVEVDPLATMGISWGQGCVIVHKLRGNASALANNSISLFNEHPPPKPVTMAAAFS